MTTCTSDRAGLERAILLDPWDDTPRLVLADWFDDHELPDRAAFIRRGVKDHYECSFVGGHDSLGWFPGTHEVGEQATFTVRRGFPSAISLPLATLLAPGTAARVGGVVGVTEVRVSDREPYRYLDAAAWGWSVSRVSRERGDPSWLPESLWSPACESCPPGEGNVWPTRDAALTALAQAACDYARGAAGLDPLYSQPTSRGAGGA